MRLTEDRPPNNITSPGVVPLDVSIPCLRVSRDKEGVFTVHQTSADAGQCGTPAVGAAGETDAPVKVEATGRRARLGRNSGQFK